LWWSPDPRTILFPEALRLNRSLRKTLRRRPFALSLDQCFCSVIEQCSGPRGYSIDTWITPDMKTAYLQLHKLGFAHSVEVWQEGQLVGGLYGVALGRLFFGESMFSRASDASKVALACLCAHLRHWRFTVIDCQMPTAHLHRLGAVDLPRRDFLRLLGGCRQASDAPSGHWQCLYDWPTMLARGSCRP
jgi:leucyl/phenylalanyl-tRNA--protein transferase